MTAPHAAAFPGPAALGRGVVVSAGAPTPPGFEDAPRYLLDDAVLARPYALAQTLHDHWVRRERVVVEHAVDNDLLRERETTNLPPWELGAWFSFERERLAHRVWANSYDLRGGVPVWWRGELALRRTDVTRPDDGADGDVVLPTGALAWVDGGPRGPVVGIDAPIIHRESIELLGRADVDRDGPPADPLANDQLAAVGHAAGPVRVLAPAGSGKTRVLTARLHHLVNDRGIQPELITAVAYNKRAAEELAGRVGNRRVDVRTIHSLAWAICRDGGVRNVLDERDVRGLLDGLVRFPKVPNTDPAQAWLEALSEVRIGLRDPMVVEAQRDDVAGLTDVLPQYRERLRDKSAVDFDEQVCHAIELLCRDPQLRDVWRRRCTHLLVDEFQDLAPAYLLLLRLLATPDLQLFGVGDDDQVIYGHAGADPRFLLEFDLLFPGAADHRLEVNYRCPPDVVGAAATLLGHNTQRVAKTIEPRPGATTPGAADGLSIKTVPALDVAGTVLDRVTTLVAGGVDPTDIAVLTRVNASLLPLQVLLQLSQVPAGAPLDGMTLRRTGIRSALAYLRIACSPDRIHRADVYETLKRPARKLSSAITPLIRGTEFWSLRQLADLGVMLTDSQADRLAGYIADLTVLTRMHAKEATAGELLASVRTDIGLGEAMERLDGGGRLAGSSHGDDLGALEQLAKHHPDPATFERWLRDALRHPGTTEGVHLSTVHRVKGEEWPHVIVAPVVDGLFPHRLTDDAEEERRVFHVAVTRGADSVTVVAVDTPPSRFVRELTTAAATPGGAPYGSLAAVRTEPLPARPTTTPNGDSVVAATGLRVSLAGGVDAVVDLVDAEQRVAVARVVRDEQPTGARVRLTMIGNGDAPAMPVIVDGRSTRLTLPARKPAAARPRRDARTGAPTLAGTGLQVTATVPDAVEPITAALKGWRAERARGLGKPAYTVFDNKTLEAIAIRQPRDEQQLLGVKGVGPAKLEQYGDEVLELVADTVHAFS